METFITLINTCGFPVAMVVLLFTELKKERESHKEEMKSVTEVINNNTLVVEKLSTKIDNIIH